jgi:hypothetical protein
MKINIRKAIADIASKQIPADENGDYWLRKSENGLHSQPISKEIVKAHFDLLRSHKVPFTVNEQYTLQISNAKYLINADGDMVLVKEK